MKLQEIYNFNMKCIEEAKDEKLVKFSAPFLVADEVNKNKRLYPFSVLKRAVNQFNSKIKEGKAWGGDQHPSSGQLETKNVSHRITRISFKNKTAWIEGRILSDTSEGSKILSMIKSGGTVGISARGHGNIKSKDGVNEIQKDYVLAGVDFVINPSVDIAQVSQKNIYESAPIEEEEEKFDISLIQFNMMVERLMEDVYEQNPNISGSAEERGKFFDENWAKYSAIIEEQLEKKGLKIEEPKKIKEAEGEIYPKEERLFDEAICAGYDRDFETFKKTLLPNLQASKEEKEKDYNLERQFAEAQASGYKKSFKEYLKSIKE